MREGESVTLVQAVGPWGKPICGTLDRVVSEDGDQEPEQPISTDLFSLFN